MISYDMYDITFTLMRDQEMVCKTKFSKTPGKTRQNSQARVETNFTRPRTTNFQVPSTIILSLTVIEVGQKDNLI